MAVFVFGSNEAGIHGAGAAKYAKMLGASNYKGFGRSGGTFAIPTKDWQIKTLPLEVIKHYVDRFIAYAEIEKHTLFHLTKIGCGLAGYKEQEIAPLFKNAPTNVLLIDEKGSIVCLARDWSQL